MKTFLAGVGLALQFTSAVAAEDDGCLCHVGSGTKSWLGHLG